MVESDRNETNGGGWVRLGAVLGLLGVALGAFGAHGLEATWEGLEAGVGAERAAWWDTGARYHLLHAVALVAGAAALRGRARGASIAFALGVVIFSGTLYGLALGGPRWLGAITPIGGVLLMLGWGIVAWRAGRGSR